LAFPANCQAPIAAKLTLTDIDGLPVAAEFDFRQTGPQSWDILVTTDQGRMELSRGGRIMAIDGKTVAEAPDEEYRELYRRFVTLAAAGASDVDLAPLRLVADAFLLGRRTIVEPFVDRPWPHQGSQETFLERCRTAARSSASCCAGRAA